VADVAVERKNIVEWGKRECRTVGTKKIRKYERDCLNILSKIKERYLEYEDIRQCSTVVREDEPSQLENKNPGKLPQKIPKSQKQK
jgi:hypothetical protein